MNDEEEKSPEEFKIHRYGLRMPESVFKVVEEIAWDSRLSINLTLVELMRRGVVNLLDRIAELDADYTSFGMTLPIYDLKYDALKNARDEDPEKFEKMKAEIQDAFIELLDWIETNARSHR